MRKHATNTPPADLTLEEKLSSLPSKPGVYQFRDSSGKILYVGKAVNLRNRVRQYFQRSRSPDGRIDAMVSKVRDLELTVTTTDVEALILEANLIKQNRPRYNVVLKDDKSYPYIVVTNEPFPRIFVTRRRFPGHTYYGPYTDVKTMRQALSAVRKAFMVRSCNYDMTPEAISSGKYKVCLDYHIKKCEGPCEGHVSGEHYRQGIEAAKNVLRGRTTSVIDALERDMEAMSGELRFEEAAAIRDKITALHVYSEKQRVVGPKEVDRDVIAVVAKGDDACGVIFKVREGKVVGSRHVYMSRVRNIDEGVLLEQFIERTYIDENDIPDALLLSAELPRDSVVAQWLAGKHENPVAMEVPKRGDKSQLVGLVRQNAQYWLEELEVQRLKRGEGVPHPVEMLQKDLRLPAPPRRIECFDNSNIQGSDPVSSMVVFVDGRAKKSEYRKFRIRTVIGPDDFESMREVVGRRYRRVVEEGTPRPDLIVIDGGKGQLSSSKEVLDGLGLQDIPLIGLAKRLEEVFLPNNSEPILLPKTSSSLKLLQRLRDEAHRFAVTFHRKVRSKRILQTELDLIDGIGKKRARELLEVFGSVQGVKFATDEQLTDVVGEKVTDAIREYYADSEGDSLSNEVKNIPAGSKRT